MKALLPLLCLVPCLMAAGGYVIPSTYIKASNPSSFDSFGRSVAIDGDTMVIGALFEQGSRSGVNPPTDNNLDGAGAAYVYVRDGGTWKQQAYLKPSNPGESDLFGYAVAIHGNTIVVGAVGEDSGTTGVNSTPNDNVSNSGAAYVFVRSGTTWIQQAYLKASNTGEDDGFGGSVAVWGDTIAIGAQFEQSNAVGIDGNQANDSLMAAGAVYVFERIGDTWSQQAYVKASNTNAEDLFGRSLALHGETLVVGAQGEDSNANTVNGNQSNNSASSAGAAYVFVRSGLSWTQQAYLKAFNAEAEDEFGAAVSISADSIVVSAPGEDGSGNGVNPSNNNGASQSGAAYVFTRTGIVWTQQAYLKPAATTAGDLFGTSVCISGDHLVIGSILEDSASSGVNGNAANDALSNSGAAMHFVRSGSSWSYATFLKAFTPGEDHNFGTSVGVSGDIIVVSAEGENSSRGGINPQPDQRANFAGAAYVFQITNDLNAIAHSGFRAPGGTDLFYGKPGAAAVMDSGQVLFEVPLLGAGAAGGKNQGIFSGYGLSGEQALVLQKGTPWSGGLGLPANARVSGFSNPVQNQSAGGLFLATFTGSGLHAANNRVLFYDTADGVNAVLRSGVDMPAFNGSRLRTLYEVLQHQAIDSVVIPYRLGTGSTPPSQVLSGTDSGILRIAHWGTVQDITMREGNSADASGKIGQVRPVASVTSNAQAWSIAKYVFNNPQDGAPYDALYRDAATVPIPPGTAAATPLAPAATLGTMLSVTAQSTHGIFRNALRNAPSTQNEALYRTDGTASFTCLLQKGAPLSPMPGEPTLTPSKVLRYWAVGADQVVVHLLLAGSGVTAKNNEAVVLLQGNGFAVKLLRKGDVAPGMHPGVTISRFNVVDVEHGEGNYLILATLAGAGASGNLALFRGCTSTGDDAFTYPLRKPSLALRKGAVYSTADTPAGTIRSITVKPAPDATGVGARGLREVISESGHIVLTITGDRGSNELVVLPP